MPWRFPRPIESTSDICATDFHWRPGVPEPEPEPEPITVADAKPARAVATDGGVVVSEPRGLGSGAEDTAEDLPADAMVHLHGVIAETTATVGDLPDFDVYCAAVEISTQHIRRLATREVGR